MPESSGRESPAPETPGIGAKGSFRRRQSQSTLHDAAKDAEVQQRVKDKLRQLEQLKKQRDAELEKIRSDLASAKRELTDVAAALRDESRPAQRLPLLERKQEQVERQQAAEAAEQEAVARFAAEEEKLSLTADEERVLRGIRAEQMQRSQARKEEDSERKQALARRASMRDASSTMEADQHDRRALESAKGKLSRQQAIQQEREAAESAHAADVSRMEAEIARLSDLKTRQEGEEFIETGEALITLHKEMDDASERHGRAVAVFDSRLAAEAMTQDEEAALRGLQARQQAARARREASEAGSTPRTKHASYTVRGGESIRVQDQKRRAEALRGAADLQHANELVSRLSIMIAEAQAAAAVVRDVEEELMGRKPEGGGAVAWAEQRLSLAEVLAAFKEGHAGRLAALKDERAGSSAKREAIDRHLDKSQTRGTLAMHRQRGSASPSPTGSPRRGPADGRGGRRLPQLAKTPQPPSLPSPDGVGSAGSGAQSPARKVVGASQRLLNKPHRRELPAIDRGYRLLPCQQTESSHRLHDLHLEMRKKRDEAAADEEARAKAAAKSLRPDEEQMLVQRMFYQQRERDQMVAKSLATKWIEKSEKKKLTGEEVKECNERMFYTRKDKRSENRAQLVKKYIDNTNPVFPKVGREQINAAFQRLAGN
eukprot:TRINITY_DN8336_c3_g1_i1.p1 TRINITY_DN8336_c3_g1~~TRINITY_DN8336_c3_g1_i1.p1  ORF type:complete len:681 (+),score=277.80 TRINITY_DN8336_c3_g1_i1:69-2045(+)